MKPSFSELCASVSLWFNRLLGLFRRSRHDAEMAEEMRAHLDAQIERNLAAGMSPDDARAAAHRQFGGVAQIQEQARDTRHFRWLDDLARDVRLGLRQLRKSPGFTAVAVLTLALGIGVNTSMFTAMQSLLMRELPYPDSHRLVHLFRTSPHSQRWPHSPANFLDQQATNDVFIAMAALNPGPLNLAEPGQPAERVRGLQASAEIFPLLDVAPALGRVFTSEEDHPGQDAVAVLSHGFWVRRFAAAPDIVGRTLRIDGETVTVIGVMPERLRDSLSLGAVDIWRPIAFSDGERANRDGNYLGAVARLKPGVSLAQARAAMDVIAARQAAEHADTNSLIGLRLVPFGSNMDPRGRRMIWLTMMLAGFVLLIACANLANLQFARAVRRTHELAIRGALGARRGRLLRQLLTESLVIALAGGLLGLVLASWGNHILVSQLTDSGEPVLTLHLNWRVLAFALGAVTASGLAFGLVPAWRVSRVNVNDSLKQGARGRSGNRSQHRLQHALIVAEMALALVLLAGAGIVVRGLHRFTLRDPGWQVEGVTTGYLNLPDKTYGTDEKRRALVDTLTEKLRALPEVESAALAWSVPVRTFNLAGDFSIDGRPPPPPGQEPLRFLNGVTPDYFAALGMRFIAGRAFTTADSASGRAVVIINETMARTFWPGESPIGQRLSGEEIVGVVRDVAFPADPSEPNTRFQSYRPFAQATRNQLVIAVRGTITTDTLRRIVTELDADLPVNEPGLASAAVERALGTMRVGGKLCSAFAVLGLLLASLGIYGVISGFVAQQRHEIGIRIALGAQMRDVLWLVVGRGLRLTLLGVAAGLVGAFGLARLLTSIAPGLEAGDPLAIVFVSVLLVGVGLFACWLPARRASKVDSMVALRAE